MPDAAPLGSTRSPPHPREGTAIRVLSVAAHNYLDDADARAGAHRDLIAGLVRSGCLVEVLTGTALVGGPEGDPSAWLARRGRVADVATLNPPPGQPPPWPYPPAHLRLDVAGLPVHLLRGPTTLPHEADDAEVAAFGLLLDRLVAQARPDVLIAHGADRLTAEAILGGRSLGVRTALCLRARGPHDLRAVLAADVLLAPTQALANELHESTGRPCLVLPDFLDPTTVRAAEGDHKYLAYFDPAPARGLLAFARIADELGRTRPDIPLLVVAGPEGRAALDGCGIDLRRHGNVHLMRPPADPRVAWGRARAALIPDLDGSCPSSPAALALLNGLPVVASDRGAMPEVRGGAGILLPLPDRLTAAATVPPTAEEVAPWVGAIVRLWDDPAHRDEQSRLAAAEAPRWDLDRQAEGCRAVLDAIRPRVMVEPLPPGWAKAVVLVPHLNGIEPECEDGLHGLEKAGVRVVRRRGCSAIDVARNEMASDALHDGFESILFVDADLGFHCRDALRLLARPEPVVAALYAKKGPRELTSIFAEGVAEVILGPDSPGLYPLKYAAAGFLRVHASAFRRLVAELELPLCNLDWGRGCWPFFQPLITEAVEGRPHYLGEDWAFSHRLRQVGITPLADASIRLYHFGRHGFSWEEAGDHRPRHRTYLFRP